MNYSHSVNRRPSSSVSRIRHLGESIPATRESPPTVYSPAKAPTSRTAKVMVLGSPCLTSSLPEPCRLPTRQPFSYFRLLPQGPFGAFQHSCFKRRAGCALSSCARGKRPSTYGRYDLTNTNHSFSPVSHPKNVLIMRTPSS